jgi:hypothetical protein
MGFQSERTVSMFETFVMQNTPAKELAYYVLSRFKHYPKKALHFSNDVDTLSRCFDIIYAEAYLAGKKSVTVS